MAQSAIDVVKRETLAPPVDIRTKEFQKTKIIAKETLKNTGYDLLHKQVVSLEKDFKVWQVLDKLGIRPFNKESVEKYKKAKCRQLSPVYLHSRPNVLDALTMGSYTCVILCSLFLMIDGFFSLGIMITLFGFLGLTVFGFFALRLTLIRDDLQNSWMKVPLCQYSNQTVPEHVLESINEITQYLPDSRFSVEYFKLDPFVILHANDKEYYIELWDEPKFQNDLD